MNPFRLSRFVMVLIFYPVLILGVWNLLRPVSATSSSSSSSGSVLPKNPLELNENSIVLITGVASQLGSELALALHYTYHVRLIIGIDPLLGGTLPTSYGWVGTGQGATKPVVPTFVQYLSLLQQQQQQGGGIVGEGSNQTVFYANKDKKRLEKKAKRELTILDLQRQRLTRLTQTLQRKFLFYKSDLRTSLPEYFDLGQISVLDTVFTNTHIYQQKQGHGDSTIPWSRITHVIHLAEDPIYTENYYPHFKDKANIVKPVHNPISSQNTSRSITLEELHDTFLAPRGKEDIKAGMMETLLEQLVKMKRIASNLGHQSKSEEQDQHPISFVYASSYEVYNHLDNVLPVNTLSSLDSSSSSSSFDSSIHLPTYHQNQSLNLLFQSMKEDQPITTPSSNRGASKLIDELIARAYYTHHNIYSIGLRFFPIYGPWCDPDDKVPLCEMAERAVWENERTKGDSLLHFRSSFSVLPNLSSSSSSSPNTGINPYQHIRDYVYIDDAVDAILMAMQYYPIGDDTSMEAPLVMNVGTGIGSSLSSIAKYIEDYVSRPDVDVASPKEEKEQDNDIHDKVVTVSIASTERIQALLGFQPRTDLKDGIQKLLSWHFDNVSLQIQSKDEKTIAKIASPSTKNTKHGVTEDNINFKMDNNGQTLHQTGIHSCSMMDDECLRGRAIFPCASECARDIFCQPSLYDDVVFISRTLTSECTTVLYTVSWDKNLSHILSAIMSTAPNSISHVTHHQMPYSKSKDTFDATLSIGRACNIAFVPEDSDLVRRLKFERGLLHTTNVGQELAQAVSDYQNDSIGRHKNELLQTINRLLLSHDFWTIVPLSIPSDYYNQQHSNLYEPLKILPKLSPGYFFSSPMNKYAIYCDNNVIFSDVPTLVSLFVAEERSIQSNGSLQSVRPILIAPAGVDSHLYVGSANQFKNSTRNSQNERRSGTLSVQEMFYNTIRMAFRGKMIGSDEFTPLIDSVWLAHNLEKGASTNDARRLRCDIFHEVFQWKISSDFLAMSFIIELHDVWSKLATIWNDDEVWWRTKSDVGITTGILSSTSYKVQSFVRIVPSSSVEAVVINEI